jgi:NAD+ synthase (glutamine-hydrolysing)
MVKTSQGGALRVALAQINPIVGDLKGNAQKIIQAIVSARKAKADLVVLPEQSLPGYPAEDLLLKGQFVADNRHALKAIQDACIDVTAIVGFIDKGKGNTIYNAAAVIHNGKHVATYHKAHLPNYGVFDEKRYFTPGNKPLLVKVKGVGVGITICEDIWVRTGPVPALAKQGAKLLVNISASPFHLRKGKEREALLAKHAKAGRAFVAYVNMVGGQDEIVFDGQSVVLDTKGKIIARARAFGEDLLVVDIPEGGTKQAVLNPYEEILQALVLGTKDYTHKNGFEKVVLGVSGGIDSALVATIAVKALGKRNVEAVFMPSRFSSDQSLKDAKELAKNLGIRLKIVEIQTILQSYLERLKPFFKGKPSDTTEENLQARIRGNLLMAFSNKFRWLVLTTGNKSETSVGYCTLYGDMAGGFAVIKDLYKEKVYQLARHINKSGNAIIPLSVLKKEPTAELRANQKDSDSLPPYPKLDPVLEGYIEENLGIEGLVRKGFSKDLVGQVVELVDCNEYKRRQAPPGVKITPLAFGKDRRYPLTNRYRNKAT